MTTPSRQQLLDQAMAKMLDTGPKPEVLLAELDDILATKPGPDGIGADEAVAWIGRVKAVLHRWDAVQATALVTIEYKLHATTSRDTERGYRELLALIHQARADLRLKTDPVSVVAGKGMVFDYFDGVRKVIERAGGDVLFVDPYLDAEFVGRYLTAIPPGVRIRLLAGSKKLATLMPAVDAFAAQSGQHIEVRSTDKIHDRYVFVDRKECYQSGASFKDGARSAPTTLTQIVDAFAAVLETYESIWASAKVER